MIPLRMVCTIGSTSRIISHWSILLRCMFGITVSCLFVFSKVVFVGQQHDKKDNEASSSSSQTTWSRTIPLKMDQSLSANHNGDSSSGCHPVLIVTPTEEYFRNNDSNDDVNDTMPALYLTLIVGGIFVLLAAIFFIYDRQVQRRNHKMVHTAARSGAIVSSIFPLAVRQRLFRDSSTAAAGGTTSSSTPSAPSALSTGSSWRQTAPASPGLKRTGSYRNSPGKPSSNTNAMDPGLLQLQPTQTHLKSYLTTAHGGGPSPTFPNTASPPAGGAARAASMDDLGFVLASKPIADLFTETTIMFADICGFTAWSSVREPSQVFTLLETVYRAFDV